FLYFAPPRSVLQCLISLFFAVTHASASVFYLFLFLLMLCPPPRSTLFPYTTLFRSCRPVLSGCRRASCGRAGEPRARYRTDRSGDRKSTRLNSSHQIISYAVFCLKKKKKESRSKSITLEQKAANKRNNDAIAHHTS